MLYKDTKYFTNLNTQRFLSERNQTVLAFINGYCGIQHRQEHKSLILYAIGLIVEMNYFIRNLNLLLPHCFLMNVSQSFVSGSKTVSVLNGKISPSVGYPTWKKWLDIVESSNLLARRVI